MTAFMYEIVPYRGGKRISEYYDMSIIGMEESLHNAGQYIKFNTKIYFK